MSDTSENPRRRKRICWAIACAVLLVASFGLFAIPASWDSGGWIFWANGFLIGPIFMCCVYVRHAWEAVGFPPFWDGLSDLQFWPAVIAIQWAVIWLLGDLYVRRTGKVPWVIPVVIFTFFDFIFFVEVLSHLR